MSQYSIETDACSECMDEALVRGHKEFFNLWPKHTSGDVLTIAQMNDWQRLVTAQYDRVCSAEEMCFVFVADCGGDSISLCEKHLAEALHLLRQSKQEQK